MPRIKTYSSLGNASGHLEDAAGVGIDLINGRDGGWFNIGWRTRAGIGFDDTMDGRGRGVRRRGSVAQRRGVGCHGNVESQSVEGGGIVREEEEVNDSMNGGDLLRRLSSQN